jgi:HPt (histidine-containing phosphotransfer) domain-containing protein
MLPPTNRNVSGAERFIRRREKMEVGLVEKSAGEQDINEKAKQWMEEYGEEFLVELIDVYLEDTPNRMAQMRQAFKGGDAETVIREAHTLKSSSANLGAMRLSNLAKQMEVAGRSGNFLTMADDMQQFKDEFVRVKVLLEELKGSPKELIDP